MTQYKMTFLHVSTTVTLLMVAILVLTSSISPRQAVQAPQSGHVVLAVDQSEIGKGPAIVDGSEWPNRPRYKNRSGEVTRVRTWDWTEIFAFVPNGIRSCQKLFAEDKFIVETFMAKYKQFEDEVKKFGWVEGNSALRIEQYLAYIKLAESPFVRTVCETGFNAGHSAFAWLEANPRTHVYSFDLGEHEYARPMADYLGGRYPGRLNVTWGDSTSTLPRFRDRMPHVKCDLLVIDGGHTNPVCQSDFDNFYRMASVDNVVILDNYPDTRLKWMTDLGNVWERGKRRGDLIEIFSCSFEPQSPHGFSVGRFNIRP